MDSQNDLYTQGYTCPRRPVGGWGGDVADASGCGEGECRSKMGEVSIDFNIPYSAVQTSNMSAKQGVSRDLESVSAHEACTLAHKRVNIRRK